MTHTPGPWQGGLQISSSKGSNIIAHIQTRTKKLSGYSNANGVYHYEALANAQIIAAAPELLEALVFCLSFLTANNDGEDDVVERIKTAKSAILKATGEQP